MQLSCERTQTQTATKLNIIWRWVVCLDVQRTMYGLLSGLNERLLANLIVQPIEESYNATGLLFEHTWFYALQLVYITIFYQLRI